ncbi:MAG TPA: hypothetical protein VIR76_04695 [Pusillimonas sp.]
MTSIRHWPVRRIRWAGLLGAVTGVPLPIADTLSLSDSGVWLLATRGAGRPLHLFHVWQAYAWITLRLRDSAPGATRPVQLTIWKFGLPAQAWRELCICVARQAALSERRSPKKEVS